MSRSARCCLLVALAALARCATVDVPATDATPPAVAVDIYGIEEPGASQISLTSTCCRIRRTARREDPLTFVASAEDADSGIRTVDIVATVIAQCTVTRSFSGGRGVPSGPPVGQTTLLQTERVLGSAAATGSPLPRQRLVNATTRLGDLEPQPCPAITVAVNDEPPARVTIAEQSTTFCGARVFARGSNGAGAGQPSATALLVVGPPRSGSFPCPAVPF